MPRPAKLPDLTGIDPVELQLMIRAILDQRGVGPEFRKAMRQPQLAELIDAARTTPRAVLQAALAALRAQQVGADRA
jgi:hypothetical protein